jgi:hypothetical protein
MPKGVLLLAQMPDCRNSGSYNRAANLCVSNGP